VRFWLQTSVGWRGLSLTALLPNSGRQQAGSMREMIHNVRPEEQVFSKSNSDLSSGVFILRV
jgi:hypothetical protein